VAEAVERIGTEARVGRSHAERADHVPVFIPLVAPAILDRAERRTKADGDGLITPRPTCPREVAARAVTGFNISGREPRRFQDRRKEDGPLSQRLRGSQVADPLTRRAV
jgi:hypothetical protein